MELQMWWVWMVLAAIFLIGEIFTAGFFLLWFSIGSALAGILALMNIGVAAQLIIFILGSGITYVFGRRFADAVTVKQPPGIGADRFVNQVGIVLTTIDNAKNTGYVRIGQEEWRAQSETGAVLTEGMRVLVVRVDGTRAIVKPIEEVK